MSSLIYNIFTNDSLDHSTSGLFLKDTSDHLRQYFPLFQDISRMLKIISIFYFVIKTPQNIEKLKLELGNVNYQVIKILTYPTEIYFNFM